MFHRIGRFVVRRAWWVIIGWLVAAVAIIATAPALTAQTDESAFLPKHYESIQASQVQEKAFPANFTPAAMVLFERTDGGKLDDADKAAMAKVVQGLTDQHVKLVETILPVSDQSTSKDGRYALSMVGMEKNSAHKPEAADSAKELREGAKKLAEGSNLKVQLGGQSAQNLDQQDSSKLANMLIGVGTIVIILLTLGIIFRSPIIALLPILSIFVFSMVANGLIADASKAFGLKADSSVSAILIIVLFGVGTDYFLFLMFRYRERLRAGDDRKEAVVNAVGRVGEAIASAAGAVIVAFSVLLLSSLGMFQALGPSLAIAVFVTALASVTLVPAILSLIPEKVLFWPSKAWQKEPANARFAAIGRTVERKPLLVTLVSGAMLVVLSFAAFGYKGTFDLASGSMPKTKESMVVQDTLMTAFSAGAADPSHVYVESRTGAKLDPAALTGYIGELGKVPGVAQVVAQPHLNADGTVADITVMLKDAPATNQAIDTIDGLRKVAHGSAPQGSEAKVGGITSVYKDINTAMARDYSLVFPVAALLIMLILALLLRSIVAPWYLMAAVGLGFGATVGATSLVFQKMQGEAGLMFMLPMFIYLFVVAIGTDYNILMIARLREEAAEGHSPRKAAGLALRHGGPTVAAAGSILALTFATMLLAGNSLFSQIGFSVAFGIAVSAFVMAMFFTPALTALLGRAAWWPGRTEPSAVAPDAGAEGRRLEPAGRS
ncbi:MMPL family transporter [Kitasatospora sp. NPDC048540]|uniref:MMPL family transporter n=1 Tax=Kitasatospora sp. NPDC048540 TaxID=3155634 RepID=UPI0034099B67